MIIKSVYIKNFKAYDKKSIDLYRNNIFIGENDSGKSTILQALNIFFNQDNIDKNFVIDINQSVEIGVLTEENKYIKKVYKVKTFKLDSIIGNIDDLQGLSYVYLSPSTMDVKKLICDLAVAKTISNVPNDLIEQLNNIMNDGISSVIDSIDTDLVVVGGNTVLNGNALEKLIK